MKRNYFFIKNKNFRNRFLSKYPNLDRYPNNFFGQIFVKFAHGLVSLV